MQNRSKARPTAALRGVTVERGAPMTVIDHELGAKRPEADRAKPTLGREDCRDLRSAEALTGSRRLAWISGA
jgi:hypothetical protein